MAISAQEFFEKFTPVAPKKRSVLPALLCLLALAALGLLGVIIENLDLDREGVQVEGTVDSFTGSASTRTFGDNSEESTKRPEVVVTYWVPAEFDDEIFDTRRQTKTFTLTGDIESFKKTYPVGSEITLTVSPSDPSAVRLDVDEGFKPMNEALQIFLLVSGIFVLALIYRAWRKRRMRTQELAVLEE